MHDHEYADHQGSTPFINRAQRRRWEREERRARRRGLMAPGEHMVKVRKLHQTPNHQTWQFTGKSNRYVVTADFDEQHSFFGHEVVLLCVDDRDNVHSACRVNGTRQSACFHIREVIGIINDCDCEMCGDWTFGDDAA